MKQHSGKITKRTIARAKQFEAQARPITRLGHRLDVVFILLNIGGMFVLYRHPGGTTATFRAVPPLLVIIVTGINYVIASLEHRRALRLLREDRPDKSGFERRVRVLRIHAAISAVGLALLVSILLYGIGVTRWIAVQIAVYYAGGGFGKALSWLATATISGIIGNTAFAMMNRLLKRAKSDSKIT